MHEWSNVRYSLLNSHNDRSAPTRAGHKAFRAFYRDIDPVAAQPDSIRDHPSYWLHPPVFPKVSYGITIGRFRLLFRVGNYFLPEKGIDYPGIMRYSRNYLVNGSSVLHDDVMKWKHFPRYWPFVREFPGSGEIPAQRPVTWGFNVFFDLRLNKRLSKHWWGWWFETSSRPLWCHCNAAGYPFTLQYVWTSPVWLSFMDSYCHVTIT